MSHNIEIPNPYRPINQLERRRLHQLKRYLAGHWITPFPVKLLIGKVAEKHNFVGVTYRGDAGHLTIRLDSRMQFGYAVETLLHEWGHAATFPANRAFEGKQVDEGVGDHNGAFIGIYGEIIEAFEDGTAYEDSREW